MKRLETNKATNELISDLGKYIPIFMGSAFVPGLAESLPDFLQGHEKNRESILAALAFLDAHFEVNPVMAAEVNKIAYEKTVLRCHKVSGVE